MSKDPTVFDYIKYYSLPFSEKLMLVTHGKHLDVFKNDGDPTISEIAKVSLKHMQKEDAVFPIHVTLKSDLDKW